MTILPLYQAFAPRSSWIYFASNQSLLVQADRGAIARKRGSKSQVQEGQDACFARGKVPSQNVLYG